VTRNLPVTIPRPANTVIRPSTTSCTMGGDTQGVLNMISNSDCRQRNFHTGAVFRYRNAWVLNKNQLTRQVLDNEGKIQIETVKIPARNKLRFRTSTGVGTSGYDAGHSGAIPPDFRVQSESSRPDDLRRRTGAPFFFRKKAEISNSRLEERSRSFQPDSRVR